MSGFTSILPEEFDALVGSSHEAFRLYMYLRQFMQRSTGEAFGKGVSWTDIAANGLYVARRSGVQGGGLYDKRKLMRVRDELIRLGTLEDIGDHATHLCFRFPIFNQNRDRYFSAQKQATPNPHPQPTPNPHLESADDTGTYNVDGQQGASVQTTQGAPYTEVTRSNITTATTAHETSCETMMQNDPIASVMLQGGMQEYHVFTGLHVISQWRQIKGFSEPAAITLIKTRLNKNPQINSVNYFTGAIEQLCAYAVEKPNHATSDLRKRDASRYASRKEPASVRLEREARELGMLY